MTPCARRGCRTSPLCSCLPRTGADGRAVLGPCLPTCDTAIPRPAAGGTLLCGPDLTALEDWLNPAAKGADTEVGSLLWAQTWLTLNWREGPWRVGDTLTTSGTPDPPAPASLAILHARAQLDAQLAAIVAGMCAWYALRGPDDGATTAQVVRWVHGHAHDLACAPFITTAWSGLARVMNHAHQVAPWRPARTVHEGIPCPNPDCRELGLVSVAGENTVTCETCGTAMTRDDFDRWVRMCAAHERATGARDWRELA